MLREYRVVVVQQQRKSNGGGSVNLEVTEEDLATRSSGGRCGFTSAVVDVSWSKGAQQVKEKLLRNRHQSPWSTKTATSEVFANRQGNEQLSVGKEGVGAASGSFTNISSTNPFHQELLRDESDSSLDLETMHLMLEPNMRPVTPDPSSRISLEIFKEHKNLAQEFLKVQTEIAYVTQHREELLSKMDPETRRQKLDLCSKLEERDALLKLEANLKKQLELINQSKAQQQQQQQQIHGQGGPQQQFPVQHNRLQTSSGRNDDTLTNQSFAPQPQRNGRQGLMTPSDTSSVSSGEVAESWVFLDSAK